MLPVETCLSRRLDRHHHAFVFVLYDMAVKDKPPNNLRICEGNDHFGRRASRNQLGRYCILMCIARLLASLAVGSYR